MKKLLWSIGCCFFVFCLIGCNKGEAEKDVIPTGADVFPEFLTGNWRSDDNRWSFTFESGGSISSIQHYFVSVPINVKEGGAYEQGRENAHSTYVLGPCIAKYDSAKHILSVDINIDYFEVVLPAGTFEGKMRDFFSGSVFQDEMLWNAEWTNYVEFVDAEKPDANSITPEIVVFKHVKER